MGTTLQHGIFLPAEGERNCYAGLASNWTILDGVVGGYSSHAANLTIHVTAADKEAWNGKADTSALTAHTGNTTIHVTAEDKQAWNGHVADTTIHVTSADKAKWDAVTSKADDSDVVHKSGNETVSGDKTFTGKIYSNDYYYGSTAWGLNKANTWENTNTFRQNIFYERTNFYHQTNNPCYVLKDTGLERGNLVSSPYTAYPGLWQDKNGGILGYLRFVEYSSGRQTAELRVSNLIKNGALDPTGAEVNCGVQLELQPSGEKSLIPETNNNINLGTSTNKWKTINGINPGALSLPDINNRVDITGYITDLTGANNLFTPTANGWICIRSGNATKIFIGDSGTNIGNSIVAPTAQYLTLMYPCTAGRGVNISINCTSLAFALFSPSLGNI